MVWDRVGGVRVRGPGLEGGNGGKLFGSCLTGRGERRRTRRRILGARPAVWSQAAAAAARF